MVTDLTRFKKHSVFLVPRSPNVAARTAIVAVAITLAWWTWAPWGDVQIDCGRELYVPTQITHGKVLYRDIWYQYGPLEPYLAALLVVLFGQYLNVFYLFGLAMAIASALLFFEIGLNPQRARGRPRRGVCDSVPRVRD